MTDRAADIYEITWKTGHIERITAHQVAWPNNARIVGGLFGGAVGVDAQQIDPRIVFHADIDGHWTLVLSALEEDIRTIRLVTQAEPIPGQPDSP